MKTSIKMQFDPGVAKELGVDCAIMLSNIDFWVDVNRKNGINLFEGRYWTYNTVKAYCELFPFWSEQNIKTILKKLITSGYLEKGRFNKKGYDKTNWYTTNPSFREGSLESSEPRLELTNHRLESTNPLVRTNQPIPDNKQDNKPDITDVTLPEGMGKTDLDRLLKVYCLLFRKKTGVDYKISFAKDKSILKRLRAQMSELEIASLLVVFFNWYGMSGSDEREQQKLVGAGFNIAWFSSQINVYKMYAKNIAGIPEDDKKRLDFVAEWLLKK